MMHPFLEARGLTEVTVRRFGLSYDQGRGAIAIPYRDGGGTLRYTRCRYLPPSRTKYHTPAGTHSIPYNVIDSRKDVVYVTEGEFDALILKQLHLDAIGIPGAHAFKPYWKWLLAGAERVVLVYDGDEEGRQGARRVAGMVDPLVESCAVIDLPEGSDINSLYLEDRAELTRYLR